ncbi:MAG: LPS assembly lipoprotein LptE [bacterium]|nr:LPS assembly lipoprotein LptE [bacterium]
MNSAKSYLCCTLVGLITVSLVGCAGYQIGNSQLYRPDIHTIYVPVFRSESYRRGVGELLTEAVIKEIELQTPHKVVQSPDADSTLVGTITDYRKSVFAENRNDAPRDLNTQLIVEVNWTARSGELLIPRVTAPIAIFKMTASDTANFIPEGGQSFASSELEAVQDLARKIVGQMELGL